MRVGKYHSVDYLGDSVYIGLDEQSLLYIFTYDGTTIGGEIHLDSDVVDNFLEAIRKYGHKWQVDSLRREEFNGITKNRP